MYNVLVLGCGNIGAGYDLENDFIQTHAKAFFFNPKTSLTLYDIDHNKSSKIATKYSARYLDSLNFKNLEQFDIISLCVNTDLHLEYLKKLIELKIPLIICEKPIVSNINEIIEIEAICKQIKTKIIVNYIRRFHPDYNKVKIDFKKNIADESIKNVIIKYNRGFLNNASHALDLVEFLTDTTLDIIDFKCSNIAFDTFSYDPTITANFTSKTTCYTLVGISSIPYSIFEIEIYTTNWAIKFLDNGNTIKFYRSIDKVLVEIPELAMKNALNNYMKYVIDHSIKILENNEETNFENSLSLNKKILQTIQSL